MPIGYCVEGFGGAGAVLSCGVLELVEGVDVSVLVVWSGAVGAEGGVAGPGGTGFIVALVCGGIGAGLPLSSVLELCEQPTVKRAPAKAATPRSFFISLIRCHKNLASATAILESHPLK